MEFYQLKKTAFDDIKKMLDRGDTEPIIILAILSKYGLSKKFVTDSIKIIEEADIETSRLYEKEQKKNKKQKEESPEDFLNNLEEVHNEEN